MAALVVGLIRQLGDKELFSVNGEDLTGEGAGIDIPPGDGENDAVGAFAIALGIRYDIRSAVGVEQLYAVDEFKVLAKDGNLFTAFDAFSRLLGITGNNRFTKLKRCTILGFFVFCANQKLSAFSRESVRNVDSDHVQANVLEIGDDDVIGEHDFLDAGQARAIDCHLGSGNHFRGEDGLDLKTQVYDLFRFVKATCRKSSHKGYGQ